jgi:hypothetical protein
MGLPIQRYGFRLETEQVKTVKRSEEESAKCVVIIALYMEANTMRTRTSLYDWAAS